MSTHDTDVFTLPDTIVALPASGRDFSGWEFSPATEAGAAAVLTRTPGEVFGFLLGDQESEYSLLVALRIVDGFLASAAASDGPGDAESIVAEVAAVRETLAPQLTALAAAGPPVLRQRAPIALLAGCWLDTVSQPATQPSVIVNHLFRHHFGLKGEGNPQRATEYLRRHALESGGDRKSVV